MKRGEEILTKLGKLEGQWYKNQTKNKTTVTYSTEYTPLRQECPKITTPFVTLIHTHKREQKVTTKMRWLRFNT